MSDHTIRYSLKLAAFKNTQNEMKHELIKLISNKQVPLEVRWNMFINTEPNLQEHYNSLVNFESLKECSIDWYGDFNVEKYEQRTMQDIIDSIEYKIESEKNKDNKGNIAFMFTENPELLNELKEEILEKNIGSFKFDW